METMIMLWKKSTRLGVGGNNTRDCLVPALQRLISWIAGLPLIEVAARSLMMGLMLSAMETSGWIGWGHEALLGANVPIIAWAAARWWTDRKGSAL